MKCDCICRFLSECFQIAVVPLPWWVVDLGATYKVVAVKLLNTVVNSKPSNVSLITSLHCSNSAVRTKLCQTVSVRARQCPTVPDRMACHQRQK